MSNGNVYVSSNISFQMHYACGVKGCVRFGDTVEKEDDVIVLTRNTQTVRAVDSRSGSEKYV